MSAQRDAVPCPADAVTFAVADRTVPAPFDLDIPAPPKAARDAEHRHPTRVVPIGPVHGVPQPATPPSGEVDAAGVPISLDVTDRNNRRDGNTRFTRTFAPHQGYVVTAPYTHSSGGAAYVFKRWAKRASPAGSFQLMPLDQLDLTVDNIGTDDDTVEARYDAQRVLTVDSLHPASGVAITVSLADLFNNRHGSTSFARSYRDGETVTLTAPATVGSNPFRRWRRGNALSPNLSVTLTLNADERIVAEYWTYTAGSFVSYGSGCPGTNNTVPQHRGTGTPETGQTIDYQTLHSRGNTGASFAIGTRSAPIPLAVIGMGTCTLDVDPIAVSLPFTLDNLGRGSVPIAIPAQTSLIGGVVSTQVTVVDLGAPTPTPLVQSNAIETRIGGLR